LILSQPVVTDQGHLDDKPLSPVHLPGNLEEQLMMEVLEHTENLEPLDAAAEAGVLINVMAVYLKSLFRLGTLVRKVQP